MKNDGLLLVQCCWGMLLAYVASHERHTKNIHNIGVGFGQKIHNAWWVKVRFGSGSVITLSDLGRVQTEICGPNHTLHGSGFEIIFPLKEITCLTDASAYHCQPASHACTFHLRSIRASIPLFGLDVIDVLWSSRFKIPWKHPASIQVDLAPR